MSIFYLTSGLLNKFSKGVTRTISFPPGKGLYFNIKGTGNYWTQGCQKCSQNFHTAPVPSSLARNGRKVNGTSPVFWLGNLSVISRAFGRRNLKTSALLRQKMPVSNPNGKGDAAIVRKAGKKEVSRLLGLAKAEKWTLTGKICYLPLFFSIEVAVKN